MPADIRQIENLFITLSGDGAADLICVAAQVDEALGEIPRMRIEFISKTSDFDPSTILGKRLKLETQQGFKWSGLVIQVEDLGLMTGGDVYSAELRPWLWLSTLGEENRIYQNMTTAQIVEDVLKPLGGAMDVGVTTPQREYCVQYKESNFAFISRLLEEDGVFYHFDYEGAVEKMVLGTDLMTGTDKGTIPFTVSNISATSRADRDTIYEWATRDRAASGKVTVWDYDFTKANTPLSATTATAAQNHGQIERYQSGGRFTTSDHGTTLSRLGAEAHAAEIKRATGLTNHVDVRISNRFKLKYPDRAQVEGNYAVLKTRSYIRFDDGSSGTEMSRIARDVQSIKFPEGMKLYEAEFEVQPADVAFHPHRRTPWPEVPNLLTAMVTGPAGEEIHTDQYGRIKVQFPWDRKGQKDDKTTCWVRTVMPWTGKGYGFVAVPRIGMEVVIQFERGNIDRPICTGMLYNSTNMPPYALPGEMNKVVWRTHSTKGGGADNFHELSFDDTKGNELTYFQSEKNYKELVKANAQINIGGSLTQVVHVNTSETVETGERTLDVQAGSETTHIAVDQKHTIDNCREWTVGVDDTLSVGGNRSQSIGGDHTETVGGNYALTIGGTLALAVSGAVSVAYDSDETTSISGNRTHEVAGDHSSSVSGSQTVAVSGDRTDSVDGSETLKVGSSQSLDVGTSQSMEVGTSQSFKVGTSHNLEAGTSINQKAGTSANIKAATSVTIEANTSITLKCGPSKVTIDPKGVTIEGPMIQIKGTGMLKAEAPMIQTQASAMLMLKGGITMIN